MAGRQAFVCSVLVGVTSIKQMEANVKAAEWSLTPEQAKKAADIAEEVANLYGLATFRHTPGVTATSPTGWPAARSI